MDQQRRLADRWPIYVLALATLVLSLPLFEPYSWWPFGFVAFVPWALAVCNARRTLHAHLASLLLGVLFFLVHLRWLFIVTPEGYVALSIHLGMYFVLASWLMRHLYRRRRVPAVIAFPVIWTAIEWVRSHGPLGFPWFLLGHSQIHALTMIQIADLAGVYGLTFVLAAVNGCLVDLAVVWIRQPRTTPASLPIPAWRGIGLVIVLVAATAVYGRYRLATEELVDGPTIAVVQGDFLLEASLNANDVPDDIKVREYLRMVDEALRDKPDMVVLPETPWTTCLNEQGRPHRAIYQQDHEEFRRRVDATDTYLVVGAMGKEPQPPGSYPAVHNYNSAYVYVPRVVEPERYDKIHLVFFGEYVPFRYNKALFWLYRWLNDSDFNPWGRGGREYSLTPGAGYTAFTMEPRDDAREYRFGITICYEDVIPYRFRRFVGGEDGRKRVDFMLNISNDGWFGHGAQQPQHLVNCAFRAVENRVAIARSVNTGVSGFIRPDGTWHDVLSDSLKHPRAGGMGVRQATLRLDPRVTFYSLHGDVFAAICGLVSTFVLLDAAGRRALGRRRSKTPDRSR